MVRDLGDFQTPPALAVAVLEALGFTGEAWPNVLEPTCGRGNFVAALLKAPVSPREIKAVELQDSHLQYARRIAERLAPNRVSFDKANIFDVDLADLRWHEKGPLLVVGNPPWVTNAELGTLGSVNLPRKTNLKGLRGIEAMTGASNFDIAEYIWLKLIKELAPHRPTIALLCKSSVARNVLQFASGAALPISRASIRKIDARKWFGAAVDACLFRVEVDAGERRYEAEIYRDLYVREPDSVIGFASGRLVANVECYKHVAFLDGTCPVTWRQGLKHDCASVMELAKDPWGSLRNKLGALVVVEPDFVYPLLKGSDLFHGASARKAVIVTQRHLGEDTRRLEKSAPQLWKYLTGHGGVFERRKSSIYRKQHPFSMFGIGDYAFAPYKVAVSGLHKTPRFRAVGPVNGRPVMLDDTSYFIACSSPEQAALFTALLNDPLCLDFLRSITFPDSKRPITKKLLQRIDLATLLDHVEKGSLHSEADRELGGLGVSKDTRHAPWPSTQAGLLVEDPPNSRGSAQIAFELW